MKTDIFKNVDYNSPFMEIFDVGTDFETILCESDAVLSDYEFEEQVLW